MLAVLVMSLITFSLYRFVIADLTAIHISTEDTAEKNSVQTLVSVLEEEFANLPTTQSGALLGQSHKLNEKSNDEISWLTQAGNGLFTQQAAGPWKVTMQLRVDDKTQVSQLGFVRELPDNKTKQGEHWLPLLSGVDTLEIRYFDHRLNTWLEKWSDQTTRPNLVRIRLWRTGQTDPYEAVIALPPSRLPS